MPASNNDLIVDEDGLHRCWWCGTDRLYQEYHDNEWGVPVVDNIRLFEKMCLEGFQAGLSWLTILRKRENFRLAFQGFDFEKVARFTTKRVDRLVKDAGIIRHRGKIESTINNAHRAIEMVDSYGSLAAFFWRYEPTQSSARISRDDIVSKTEESTAMSKDLKRMGWSFVGPTTCYALMQAMGMVNDHLRSCDSWEKVESARDELERLW